MSVVQRSFPVPTRCLIVLGPAWVLHLAPSPSLFSSPSFLPSFSDTLSSITTLIATNFFFIFLISPPVEDPQDDKPAENHHYICLGSFTTTHE